jgi:predicted ATP-grasp superfamily ATP-dependent carboligase
MTQMTAAAAIKKHGDKAVEALLVEFCQSDNKAVIKPMTGSELTVKQKHEALRAINIIKEKRCGKLKAVPVLTVGRKMICMKTTNDITYRVNRCIDDVNNDSCIRKT